jgi:hypothetical protein
VFTVIRQQTRSDFISTRLFSRAEAPATPAKASASLSEVSATLAEGSAGLSEVSAAPAEGSVRLSEVSATPVEGSAPLAEGFTQIRADFFADSADFNNRTSAEFAVQSIQSA